MIENAIVAKNLRKVYRLYNNQSDRLKEIILRKPFHHEFVSLDDINITLRKGETLGIIGENGAGKSTLLKIMAKTLAPTSGTLNINGRVSSLLELGSGFHPEFTGIENIFFYGALLGIDKITIQQKLNNIIEFAEIGDFINYPIKTYSSGMFVRLAFSVATTLDPDILIIDEALSVGDQYFQKKCLDKIAEFKKKGKTIVFCSHDMYQIKTFCENAIWLNQGKIQSKGKSDDVVNAYTNNEIVKSEKHKEQSIILQDKEKKDDKNNAFIFIKNLSAKQRTKQELSITFDVQSYMSFEGHIGWAILRHDYLQLSFDTTQMQKMRPVLFNGLKKINIEISNLNIVNGSYIIYSGIFDKEAYKPIAVESISIEIETGYEILNSLCYFNSKFIIER